jgi:hypothetical protein
MENSHILLKSPQSRRNKFTKTLHGFQKKEQSHSGKDLRVVNNVKNEISSVTPGIVLYERMYHSLEGLNLPENVQKLR